MVSKLVNKGEGRKVCLQCFGAFFREVTVFCFELERKILCLNEWKHKSVRTCFIVTSHVLFRNEASNGRRPRRRSQWGRRRRRTESEETTRGGAARRVSSSARQQGACSERQYNPPPPSIPISNSPYKTEVSLALKIHCRVCLYNIRCF